MVEWIEIPRVYGNRRNICVSTLVVEWIEIFYNGRISTRGKVSTLVVEWIEICIVISLYLTLPSPPSWWSGLKLFPIRQFFLHRLVSTLVVEWIEIIPGWEEHPNVEGLHPRGGVD